jgi:glycosyltransferase involved in cell wall biosynthesis
MRIVIDMQGAQTASRFRGIGRYTLSFAQAVARNRGEHEIILALNGLFPNTIEPIRVAFDGLLPQENIRVWHAPGPVQEEYPSNAARREVAELIREAFLASLQPDVIHISSFFEGYVDDAVTSIGRFDHATPVSVSFYDLIPLLNPDHYLKPNSQYRQFYLRKVEQLKKAAVYLAISEFTRQEGLAHLDTTDNSVVNVSSAVESHFQALNIDDDVAAQLRQKFSITRPFILCTGGADERKNLPQLIQAFAALPAPLRAGHNLLLGGKFPESNIAEFKHLAKSAGLKPDQLCIIGYVTDEELIQLYNLCKLFVFPSWYEGFGLPALEAMACGAPVIGSNTTSLPEVIGHPNALFDPHKVAAITQKIAQVLGDAASRAMLTTHGLKQAKKFSWDETARRAMLAFESLHGSRENSYSYNYIDKTLYGEKLIRAIAQCIPDPESPALSMLASCLAQNQNAGIERQLVLDISELCQRDAATGVQRVVRSYLKALLQSPPAGFRVEPVYATQTEGYRYARRFTQGFLGQGTEHLTDEPVRWQHGDIFFGLDMQHHVQLAHSAFYRQIKCDGVTVKFLIYDLLPIELADLFKDSNAKELHEQWLTMIAATNGAICISKATADAFDDWIAQNTVRLSPNFQTAWVHCGGDIEGSQPSQGLPPEALSLLNVICSRPSFLCVSTLEPRKGQQQIVDAFQLLWDEGLEVNLILVGQKGWKSETIADSIRNHPEKDIRLFWLQGISDEYLEKVYAASTCLIAASVNEGFGLSLIEAARHSVPIVARDIPVFREVADDCAFYFSGNTALDLATSLKTWLGLHLEGGHPKTDQLRWSTWQESAEKLKTALVQENYPRRQLLVDVSELVQRDGGSGIQRVVRSILQEWLNNPPKGYRVEPVYATVDRGYRYARCFTQSFLGYPDEALQDETMEYAPGDVFFGLDLQPQVVSAQRAFYQTLRRQGVKVQFAVYDLLCILLPLHFPQGAADGFNQWLGVVAESDGALCISKAVAGELTDWVKENGPVRQRLFKIDWFHLGADVDNSAPSKGLPADAENMLGGLNSRSSFLMVGTLEPRKGHAQVLEAFDQLWQAGQDINLIILGKQGWMVESLVERLRAHTELNKRLFWLEGISDECLEKVYAASTCLIAASYGEGFGLPLIEAAKHKLPIIARDIPVFREVAGEHAYYFDDAAAGLAQAIKNWVALYEAGRHPTSDTMPWLTWKESATGLLGAMSRS